MSEIAVVTGACGFLGSSIVRTLEADGYDVIGVDRIEGSHACSDMRLMALPDTGFASLLAEASPALVVHTAGPASVAASVADPLADFEGSVRVHAHVLDAVRRESPKARVVILSSAAVYGDPEALPVREGAKLSPISPYGAHKVMCEQLAREYAEMLGVATCALRVFSAYGEGLRRQIVWDVCEKAAASERVELSGTGDESRDFIHADDVAEAVRVAARSARFEGEVYNTASGTETTIREIAKLAAERIRPGAEVVFSGISRQGDPLRWRADVSALRALGFEPKVGLAEGIDRYCRWYRQVTG